jgi:hypothetical protein
MMMRDWSEFLVCVVEGAMDLMPPWRAFYFPLATKVSCWVSSSKTNTVQIDQMVMGVSKLSLMIGRHTGVVTRTSRRWPVTTVSRRHTWKVTRQIPSSSSTFSDIWSDITCYEKGAEFLSWLAWVPKWWTGQESMMHVIRRRLVGRMKQCQLYHSRDWPLWWINLWMLCTCSRYVSLASEMR